MLHPTLLTLTLLALLSSLHLTSAAAGPFSWGSRINMVKTDQPNSQVPFPLSLYFHHLTTALDQFAKHPLKRTGPQLDAEEEGEHLRFPRDAQEGQAAQAAQEDQEAFDMLVVLKQIEKSIITNMVDKMEASQVHFMTINFPKKTH